MIGNTDALFGRDILHVDFQHFLANNTFHFGEGDRGKVAVGCLLKAVFSCCNLFLSLFFKADTSPAVLGIRMKSSPVTSAS